MNLSASHHVTRCCESVRGREGVGCCRRCTSRAQLTARPPSVGNGGKCVFRPTKPRLCFHSALRVLGGCFFFFPPHFAHGLFYMLLKCRFSIHKQNSI